ncbi:MAG TPA: molybdate ABC transporter permease subunit [Acidobacteriota bacterium]|nr:molybdate ABC transporter permease subunit [Acidobacteriota bacterium]
MDSETWQILRLTIGVSLLSTALIIPFGLGLAWLLARKSWPGKSLVETVVALPLVLPPVATGFLLLMLLGRRGVLGSLYERLTGSSFAFTWRAVVAAMMVMSFPLLVRSARVAFEEVNPRLEQVAATLGSGPLRVFSRITFPLALRGIMAGVLLAFARGLGEFGATIIVAGNIPGKTSTLALSIYRFIEDGNDAKAISLIAISIVIAFLAIWSSDAFLARGKKD